jgi:hypothetical protein
LDPVRQKYSCRAGIELQQASEPLMAVDLLGLRHSQWRQQLVIFALVVALPMIMSREFCQRALQFNGLGSAGRRDRSPCLQTSCASGLLEENFIWSIGSAGA